MAAIFTKQSGIRAVSVGADAHIGPLGSYEFAEDFRKKRYILRADRVVRPYGEERVSRPGLPRQCENQIMLGCQQSGVSRPIMVTMVGATLARP